MSERPIPEQLEIIEMCIRAIWEVLDDDLDCSGAMNYLDRAADDLDSARWILEKGRS
nr:MAG TPA: hypothetical protein [Caudoviricetes sp.]